MQSVKGEHPFRRLAIQMFMPWKIPDRFERACATVNMVVFVFAITMFFTDKFWLILLVLLSIQIPMILIAQYRFWRSTRHLRRSSEDLAVIEGLVDGSLTIDQLTPAQQEDIKVALAAHRLKDNPE